LIGYVLSPVGCLLDYLIETVYHLDPPPAAFAVGSHYREMADKLRELARLARMPGMRKELVDLAKRYNRRGDYFDQREG
jgi:hypothetical protein